LYDLTNSATVSIKVLICRNDLLNTSAIIYDSLARPCHKCDVREVRYLLPPPSYIRHCHDIVNPLPSWRVTSFMDDPVLTNIYSSTFMQWCR